MILFPALTAIYTVAAVGEERDFSRSAIHAEYEAFRRETGILLAEAQTGAASAVSRPPPGAVSGALANCRSSVRIMASATILQFGSSIMSWATLPKTYGSIP